METESLQGQSGAIEEETMLRRGGGGNFQDGKRPEVGWEDGKRAQAHLSGNGCVFRLFS